MFRLRASPRTIFALGLAAWLVGLVLIWSAVPYGPRIGWQPPANEVVCGTLADGPTLVTTPYRGARVAGSGETGPIRLWDIATGELRGEHFTQADLFDRVLTDSELNLLKLQTPLQAQENWFSLRVFDPWKPQVLAEFKCHVPRRNVWWLIAPDGCTTAFVSYENDLPHVELWDIPTARQLHVLNGVREPIRFSPDGKRLAATADNVMIVFELPSGQEITRLTPEAASQSRFAWPKEFTPDNNLLLDSACRVWELATGTCRFQVPSIYYNSSLFTKDGKYLVVVAKDTEKSWLAYYDVITGEEVKDRRLPLVTGNSPGMHLGPATDDRRFLLATGTPTIRPPSTLAAYLARVPLLSWLNRTSLVDAFVLINTSTGHEVMRGGSDAWSCTPDGKYIITRSRDEVYQLWDVPPRKPWPWLYGSCLAWTLFCVILVSWKLAFGRGRRSPTPTQNP